jgi:ligand-binding sensor domain-containing protein
VITDHGPVKDAVTSLAEDPEGGLWAATEGSGLLHLTGTKLVRYTTRDGLPHASITQLVLDPEGGFWLTTASGLVRLENGRFTRPALGQEVDGYLWAVLKDRHGSLWLGTAGRGLVRLRQGSAAWLDRARGLTVDEVETLYEDRDGTVWIGTNGGGLLALSDERFTVYGKREGLLADYTSSIYEDRHGTVWIGSIGGLDGLHPDGRTETYSLPRHFSGTQVFTLAGGRDGSLWIGTQAAGVYELKQGRFRTFRAAQGLGSDDVRALEEDGQGHLWIGTKGGGLSRLKDGKIVTYTTQHGLSHNHVTAVRSARDGSLWVGTHIGLNRYRDGVFRVYGKKDGLVSEAIHVLWEDEEGTLWIGTAGGLARFRDGRFTSYTMAQGLHDDLVLALVGDLRGDLWLGCNRGIFRVSKQQLEDLDRGRIRFLTPAVYTRSDGLRSDETSGVFQNTAWRSKDGRVWFAMYGSAAVTDPAWMPSATAPVPVYLESVHADRRPLPRAGPHELPAGRGELEFEYTAVELRHPERIRYKYKLEGYDQDWIDAGTRRSAYYTNLPPGQYRFRVLAAAGHDGAIHEGEAFSLYLSPHFHQTRWFYALCGVAAGAVIWGGHRLRVRELRRRERVLEERVQAAVANLRVLSGLLPICAWCKKIRDDKGYWTQIESYIADRSQADFSHGVCPECAQQMRPKRASTPS